MLLLNKIKLKEKYKDNLDLAIAFDMEKTNLTRSKCNILDDDVFECPPVLIGKLDPYYYLDVEAALLQLIFLGEQTLITGTGKIVIALMINGLKNKHYYWTSEELVEEYKSSTGVVIHEKSVKNELENSNIFVSGDGSSYYLDFKELKQAIRLKD